LLGSASFHVHLLALDKDVAASAADGRCPVCGGPLHVSNYARKPRGFPESIGGREHDQRFSFCCGRDNCRKRLTPPSVRFLDRRVYSSVIIVIATMLTQGSTGKRMKVVAAALAIDQRTIERWVSWWRDDVTRTASWQALRGNLPGTFDSTALPLSLYDMVLGVDIEERFTRVLKLIDPWSQSEVMRARFSRAAE